MENGMRGIKKDAVMKNRHGNLRIEHVHVFDIKRERGAMHTTLLDVRWPV